jgi:cell division protein ZipA
MSELRWWLLTLGVLFFAGLTVWEVRRPRQARRGDAPPEPTRPREPTLQLPEMHALESLASRKLPVVELPEDTGGFPVLEAARPEAGGEPPASQAEADAALAPAHFEVPPAEPHASSGHSSESRDAEAQPDEAQPDEAQPDEAQPDEAQPDEAQPDEARTGATASAVHPRDLLPELPAAAAPLVEWPPDDQRRVVALRLVAPLPERFAGRSLRQALAAEGFVLGRFDIFHKPDEARRAILSAASLTRPGTFDADTMDSQHFGGLSLFAVLPGPMSPPQAFEELVTAARNLNDRLCGVLQDEAGTPLTPARIASLRERISSGALS